MEGTLRDPAWRKIGRIAAWVNAVCYFAAAVLFLLVDLEITWSRAEFPSELSVIERLTRFFATEQDRWPQEIIYTLLFALGFLALIPIGLALRDVLGRNLATSQMVAASFLAGGVIGTINQLAFVGGKEEILDLSGRCIDCPERAQVLISLNSSLTMLDGVTRWVGLGFFLLAGFGILFSSFAAFDRPQFSQGWIRLGMTVGLLYFAGVVAAGLDLDVIFEIIVGIGGGVLAPIWAAWLAVQLGKSEELKPPDENPVPAEV